MECRGVTDSLSDYLDSQASHGNGIANNEKRVIEEHLDACPACQNLKLELIELKTAARELPLHTPPHALWMKIANVLEAELPASERKTREEFPNETWWDRLKARKFTFGFPQMVGAGALAIALIVFGLFGISGPTTRSGDFKLSDAQSALLPDEDEIKADLNRRLVEVNQRKSAWEPTARSAFEQRLAEIEVSLDNCRNGLRRNPGDQTQQQTLRSLYNEKRQLLLEVEKRQH